MQIAPSVYFYPFTSFTENNCNTIILDGPEKVLIDPGHKRLWPALKTSIEADGLAPEDIKLVIHTHCHPDHLEAGEILEREYGAVQAMHRLEADFLKGPGRNFFPMMGLEYFQGTIDRLLEEGPIELAGQSWQIYLTPGHSPGGICLHRPEAGTLITGDLIFVNSVGRTDFPGGSHQALAGSIARMESLSGLQLLLPGHGPAISGLDQVRANFQNIRYYL